MNEENATAEDAFRARRLTALRGARALSQPRVATLREHLSDLAATAEDVYDLGEQPDFYGDGVFAALEERVAALLGTEDAACFPTGTMAQQIALRCWAGRTGNPVVATHPQAHLEVHERDAYSVVSGLRSIWPTTEPRAPRAAEIRGADEPFGTLLLELPLREAGFVLPDWDELTAVCAAARERDAAVHLDGARLWETAPHYGRPLAEIAGLADSVYVSFYKSLGAISGAALAGPADFVEEARAWRHRYGGRLFQQWPAALSALAGLDRELPRLPEYVAHASVVAAALRAALADVPGARVHPEVPHTHQFQVWLPYSAEQLEDAGVRLAEEERVAPFGRWGAAPVPGFAMTEMTVASDALDWTAADVEKAVAALLQRLAPRTAPAEAAR